MKQHQIFMLLLFALKISKRTRLSGSFCNLGQNICRLFHVLVQFVFTKSETKLDYYHLKMNIWFALRVTEQVNFNKVLYIFDGC